MTPSAGASLPSSPRTEKWMPAWMPSSVHVPSSTSSARRSRAVSLSAACWRAIRSSPPPSIALARRSCRSSTSGRRIEGGASVLMHRTVPVGSGKSYSLLRPPSHVEALALGHGAVSTGVGRGDRRAVVTAPQPLERQLDAARAGLQRALQREPAHGRAVGAAGAGQAHAHLGLLRQ